MAKGAEIFGEPISIDLPAFDRLDYVAITWVTQEPPANDLSCELLLKMRMITGEPDILGFPATDPAPTTLSSELFLVVLRGHLGNQIFLISASRH